MILCACNFIYKITIEDMLPYHITVGKMQTIRLNKAYLTLKLNHLQNMRIQPCLPLNPNLPLTFNQEKIIQTRKILLGKIQATILQSLKDLAKTVPRKKIQLQFLWRQKMHLSISLNRYSYIQHYLQDHSPCM